MRGEIEALLERSEELESLRGALAAAEAGGGGRLILVAGEAGIGKTALLRELCRRADRSRVMWGACDALHTPRPLGPLLDVAGEEGGRLAAVVEEGSSPSAVAGGARQRPPTEVAHDPCAGGSSLGR
jgi:predicted ATPase